MGNKNGTGHRPAPKGNKQVNYNRISNLCLGMFVISFVIICIAYAKGVNGAVYMGLGIMFASAMVEIAMSNEEDKEDE